MNKAALVERMIRNEADIAFRRRVRTIFEWLEPDAGDRILDAPCGRGFYLKMLQHAGVVRVAGLDSDRSVLSLARKNTGGDAGLSEGDLQDLPFTDGAFDAVICSEGLEHVEDDRAAMSELVRVVRPGGIVTVTVPNANYPFWWDPLNWMLESSLGRHIPSGPLAGIWANHLRLYSAEQLRGLAEQTGLRVEEERSFTHHCLPFSHNLVYGLGKPLLESGLLPGSMAEVVDRTRLHRPAGRWNPMRFAVRCLQWFDRWNGPDEPEGRSTVSLAIKCRRP